MIGVNSYAWPNRHKGAFSPPRARVGLIMLGHGTRPPLGYAGCGCRGGYGCATCGGYGADPVPEAAPAGQDSALYATAAGTALKALTQGSADESVEVLTAKIENQTRLMRTFPEPVKTVYRNNIAVLKARLRAATRARSEESKTTETKREFAQLGQAGIVGGLLVGGALILFLLSRSAK